MVHNRRVAVATAVSRLQAHRSWWGDGTCAYATSSMLACDMPHASVSRPFVSHQTSAAPIASAMATAVARAMTSVSASAMSPLHAYADALAPAHAGQERRETAARDVLSNSVCSVGQAS